MGKRRKNSSANIKAKKVTGNNAAEKPQAGTRGKRRRAIETTDVEAE